MKRLAAALAVTAALLGRGMPLSAQGPIASCTGAIEANMNVGQDVPLGSYDAPSSGVVVEHYENAAQLVGAETIRRPAPVPALDGFQGVRVTQCDTGEFLAIRGQDPFTVAISLAATEFLRDALRDGQPVRFPEVRRAAEALYGSVIVLRETDQTCACYSYFNSLRPRGQTPLLERTDFEPWE